MTNGLQARKYWRLFMAKEQKGFITYGDFEAVADELTDEQLGQIMRAKLKYFNSGKAPKFEGILKYVWIPIQQQMDRDSESYEKKCAKMRENANKRWANTDKNKSMQLHANDANTKTNTDTNTKTDRDTNTMSAETDAGLLSFDLIQYLNEKTGSDYKADLSNAKRVQSLLESGYSPDQLRTVIDKKVSEWYGDEKMRPYLRPSTLFGDKFGEYLAAPISVTAEKQQKANLERASLEDQLNEKRKALAYMKDSLKEATKEERRNLRDQIAILEDSIGLIERRLT